MEPAAATTKPTSAGISRGRRQLLFRAIAVLFAVGFSEAAARLAIGSVPDMERVRAVLTGELRTQAGTKLAVPQPYLVYAPAPAYANKGIKQHNVDGYRGKRVPLEREAGVLRVLAMGGSTTYSTHVAEPSQAYPAQLEQRLREMLPEGKHDVDVINAGLPSGTSAELLTHYLFKWHYYRPDVAVINTGGNDANAFVKPYYQPDYSHARRQPRVPTRLDSSAARLILRSRLMAIMLIPTFYGAHAGVISPSRGGTPPTIAWYRDAMAHDEAHFHDVPERFMAFRHNLTALVRAMRDDGVSVVLVPFRSNPAHEYELPVAKALELNERILSNVARAQDVTLAPFDAAVIVKGRFEDNCHLDAAGASEKAAHLAPHVARAFARPIHKRLTPAAGSQAP